MILNYYYMRYVINFTTPFVCDKKNHPLSLSNEQDDFYHTQSKD